MPGPFSRAERALLLPTGDPERHIEVNAVVLDSTGRSLLRETLTIGAIYTWDPMDRFPRKGPGILEELASLSGLKPRGILASASG